MTATVLFVLAAARLCAQSPARSGEIRVDFLAAPFLPVFTTALLVHVEHTPHLYYGAGVGGFYVLGRSIHAELFIEPVYLRSERWMLSSRFGVTGGWSEEFSFGPPPRSFPAVGVHIGVIDAAYRIVTIDGGPGSVYLRAGLGAHAVTNLAGVAGTVYLGLGAGVAVRAR